MKIREFIDRFGCLTDRIRAITLAPSFLIAAVAALDLAQLLNRIREAPINEIADPTTVFSAVVLLGGIIAIFTFRTRRALWIVDCRDGLGSQLTFSLLSKSCTAHLSAVPPRSHSTQVLRHVSRRADDSFLSVAGIFCCEPRQSSDARGDEFQAQREKRADPRLIRYFVRPARSLSASRS